MERQHCLELRVEEQNQGKERKGDYVLYWMISSRRPFFNWGLEYARDCAEARGCPLLIVEALRYSYPWACDRFHAFVLQGMRENKKAFDERGVTYFPFVETKEYSGKGLLEALAQRACLVVTDEFPAFFLPAMVEAAAEKLNIPLVTVDSNGMIPLRAPEKLFSRAYDFRRYIHSDPGLFTECLPERDPLSSYDGGAVSLDEKVLKKWPQASEELLKAEPEALKRLPIDHEIKPVHALPGGYRAAQERFEEFLDRIDDYADRRNNPKDEASSGLSPYLHFGHISSAELFEALRKRYDWSPEATKKEKYGKNQGFWGMSAGAETFIDQFWTWRELGFNRSFLDPEGYSDYETLPDWAKKTLEEHSEDPREELYTLKEFEEARTADQLWNAAQNELRRDGRIHNYLRMLWGKKILHWSESPQKALEIMIELNNKYALDGRDPNSYSGIFWVLGRFDRAWGPEREIFGKIRYMTSDSTRRKYKVDEYIEEYTGSD